MSNYTGKPDLHQQRASQGRGEGHNPSWLCLGCNKPRQQDGSRGQGIRKRCGICVAAKGAK